MPTKKSTKGQDAEEAMRAYFLSTGYFVVRGVPFRYRAFDVTDLDLWLYAKPSTLTRQRINVDIKRKKTPQALERIFWAKGLREVLGLDACFVATSEKREEIKAFGRKHDVLVLDGDFQKNILSSLGASPVRIAEEDLIALAAKEPDLTESSLKWKDVYVRSKSVLIGGLGFDGCNMHLTTIKTLLDNYIAGGGKSEATARLLCVLIAYFLITIDYASRTFATMETSGRREAIADGLRFGSGGKTKATEVLDTALRIVTDFGTGDLLTRGQIQAEIDAQLAAYPAETIAEFAAKRSNMMDLFSLAVQFERSGYAVAVPSLSALSAELKSVLGVLCDFFGIDRKEVL